MPLYSKCLPNNCHLCLLLIACQVVLTASVVLSLLKTGTNETSSEPDVALTVLIRNLFRLQTNHWLQVWSYDTSCPEVVIVSEPRMWRLSVSFQQTVSSLQPATHFIELCVHSTEHPSTQDLTMLMQIFHNYYKTVHTVVLFLKDDSWVQPLFTAICSTNMFKWTSLRHITEWILVTRNPHLLIEIKSKTSCVDFITLIVQQMDVLIVARKSRGRNGTSYREQQVKIDTAKSLSMPETVFRDLSRTRKSSLEGLHLPAAIVPGIKKFTEERKDGNVTRYVGYCIELLEMMADTLGFTYSIQIPTDGGSYGVVYDNDTITGTTGLLARREAALSTMNLAKTPSRLPVIDYLDYPTSQEAAAITYLLPKTDSQIDTTLLSIVHADLLLILLGPLVVMLVIGGLTHLLTSSCSKAAPTFNRRNWRNLGSFPDHICFQAKTSYAGQTARILRASWGIFWVIFSAAYSAYLVTTFTVKPSELKLNTLEKLYEQRSRFRIGMPEFNSAMFTHFQTSNDTATQKIWRLVQTYSQTDPSIISSNITEHALRIMAGNYALINKFDRGDIQLYLDVDTVDVRSYVVRSLSGLTDGYMSFPQNTFYIYEVHEAALKMEAAGALSYLRRKYLQLPTQLPTSAVRETSVSLSRVELLIYATLGGTAAGFVCLVVEILYVRVKDGKCWTIEIR